MKIKITLFSLLVLAVILAVRALEPECAQAEMPNSVQEPAQGRAAENLVDEPQRPANRLIQESSPYLLLHAYNPVEWYPWGSEAIEKAGREDKPIFLSVGYSTCYWCHVMEREVFSKPEIARLMNQWFVSIKVDREERPDLDEIYITATSLLTGSAGWPNSVFLTPDLKPFYAGTYFPPEDRYGRPGFPRVLEGLHDAWINKREQVRTQAERVAEGLSQYIARRRWPAENVPTLEAAQAAVDLLKKQYDSQNGGFGGAPKFPSPSNLYLLWQRARSGDEESRKMVLETLLKMGQGAIYDQIGGGFHRYTLDAAWRIPHFEKMLYDNAHLAELLVLTGQESGNQELERLARGTLDFVLEKMTLPEGAFKSAIDAETDSVEGAYYIWTRDEVERSLDPEAFQLVAPLLGLDGEPNFEKDRYTLYLKKSLDEYAKLLKVPREELLLRLQPHLQKLRQVRSKREFPLVDDKVLTDWNGMMIAAMARASRLQNGNRYLEAAQKAAQFLLDRMRDSEGVLLHAWRNGEAKIQAFLDDYAFFVRGLLALYEATGEKIWLRESERLAGEMEIRLAAPGGGYYMSQAQSHLLFQTRNATDGAIPSGNGVALLDLLQLADHTGKALYLERAEKALRAFAGDLETQPGSVDTVAQAVFLFHQIKANMADPLRVTQKPESAVSGIEALARSLVTAEIEVEEETSVSKGWKPFRLKLKIQEGWHINANPASLEYLIPTKLEGSVRSLRYPEGKSFQFAFAEEKIKVYSGIIEIHGEVEFGSESLALTYQACDQNSCLVPVTREIPLPDSLK